MWEAVSLLIVTSWRSRSKIWRKWISETIQWRLEVLVAMMSTSSQFWRYQKNEWKSVKEIRQKRFSQKRKHAFSFIIAALFLQIQNWRTEGDKDFRRWAFPRKVQKRSREMCGEYTRFFSKKNKNIFIFC